MNDRQYIFTICDMLGITIQDGGFSVGRWADYDMTPKGEPEIVHWFLDKPQPSHDDIVAHWEQAKDRYVDPFDTPKTVFSVREFRARFTQDEQIAIRSASMTDMEVGIVYDDFQASQFIDLNDPAVAVGVDLYISKGLLEAARRADLLSPDPSPETAAA